LVRARGAPLGPVQARSRRGLATIAPDSSLEQAAMDVRQGNAVMAGDLEELKSEPAALAEAGERRYAVRFTATGEEYFRVWIVNLALTIVTLGIYSAWAKVRKKRYFYGHTLIDGEPFEYRGSPVAILKGRVIAFVLLALYSLSGELVPLVQPLLLVVLAVAVPWLVVRSLAFNAWNSAYRNVQFHFRGTYAEALRVVVGNGLLVLISLGLLYPYWKARLARFIAQHHCYGETAFRMPGLAAQFYRVYLKAAALLFGYMAFGMLALAAVSSAGGGIAAITSGLVLFIVAGYVVFLLAFASVKARITNVVWNPARVGTVRFESALRTGPLAWLYFVNIVAIVASLGLAIPWAVVRAARYRCDHTAVVAEQGLDQ
jgi:uncharacterized membrane protein YjgN (DUF898 family)